MSLATRRLIMRAINCKGSSYEIGIQHGRHAMAEIQGSLAFYKTMFQKTCAMKWPQVCQTAMKFVPYLERSWPWYMEEMKGVAHGAGVDVESILALNVRTEIAYGMFSDGCTALSYKSDDDSLLAQNWDWEIEQKSNLVALHIHQQAPKPAIHMITEGGIIGKIGLNSAGVGVTLNAIKEKGVDFNKLPCHLSLRAVLDSTSRANAVETIDTAGVAASCHIIVADSTGSTGLECTANDIIHMPMSALDGTASDEGVATTHTNHFLYEHPGAKAPPYLEDSVPRLARIRELMADSGAEGNLTSEKIGAMLMDEKGFPTSICRGDTTKHMHATVFSIVMDLKDRSAKVKVGRPVAPDELVDLRP